MLNNIKLELTKPYNEQLEEYSLLKSNFKDLEQEILSDSSEKTYKEELNQLKNKHKKASDLEKKDIEALINKLNIDYKNIIDKFNINHQEYIILKDKLSKINVFLIKSKIEKINSAKTLEELGMDIDKTRQFCEEHGINFVVDLDTM